MVVVLHLLWIMPWFVKRVRRHNELRDAIRDLAALVWRYVHHELIIQDSSNEHDVLVADLGICGVWQPQAEALFDINMDTQSYQSHSPQTILASAEAEKKRKYSTACSDHCASFTPLCFSVDGLLSCEADVFLKQLANHLFDT